MSEPVRDPTLTRQGFVKANHLTPEAIDGVLADLAKGLSPGRACRNHGTSFTQFLRRVHRDEELEKRYRRAEAEGRQAADLSS